MSTADVKKSLGNPDKIVELGEKEIYIYKGHAGHLQGGSGDRRSIGRELSSNSRGSLDDSSVSHERKHSNNRKMILARC
jgi:hypothetical protein